MVSVDTLFRDTVPLNKKEQERLCEMFLFGFLSLTNDAVTWCSICRVSMPFSFNHLCFNDPYLIQRFVCFNGKYFKRAYVSTTIFVHEIRMVTRFCDTKFC
jgi:hypothetical protein